MIASPEHLSADKTRILIYRDVLILTDWQSGPIPLHWWWRHSA
jgi:hypothetical protein